MKQISKLILVAVGVVFLVGCLGVIGTLHEGDKAEGAGKYAEAMRLYKKAIKQGFSNEYPELSGLPEYNIGVLYKHGRGVPKDQVEALRWFRIAARKGSDLAMFEIARVERKIAAAKEKQQAEQRRIAEAKRKAEEELRRKAEESRIAESKERKRNIEALIARGDVNQRNADTNTAMHLAAEDNDVKLIQRLIAANADVNIVNKRADRPLHFAARANSREAVKALLRAGANPYKPNLKNESAMAIAVESGDEDLIGEFVLAGVEVNLLADLSTEKAQRDWETEQEQKRQAEAKRLAEEARKRAEEQAAEARRLAEEQEREAERLAEAQRKAEQEARTQQMWTDLTNTAVGLVENYTQLKANINNTNRANAALAAAQQAATAAARQASAAERQAAVAEQQAAVTQTTTTPKSSHSSLAVVRTSESRGYGWSIGSGSKLQADNEALGQCRLTSAANAGVCSIAHRWEGAGCLAVARGNNGSGAWAAASSQSTAEQLAVNKCGSGCTVSESQCVSW